MDPKAGASSRITYEEFEPFCKWQREEARDTLILTLPEFKKEQLKVHINNRGVLKVSGERSVDARKKSKFYKEVVVPKNCNTNDIQAKFANGQLYIIMPKNTNVAPEGNQPQQVGGSNIPAADQIPKPEATQEGQATPSTKSNLVERERSVSRGKQFANISMNVGMLVAVLLALVAFVMYMYKSTIIED